MYNVKIKKSNNSWWAFVIPVSFEDCKNFMKSNSNKKGCILYLVPIS